MTTPPLQSRTWSSAALLLAACGVAFVVFGRTISFGFTYDDVQMIVHNALVHDLANWRVLLAARWWNDAMYRPLTLYSFALNWAAGNGGPAGFHAINVLLHVLNTALVFLLARRWLGKGGAAAGALLFAVHPVHVEAVANVVGRAELLAVTGVLMATLAYRAAPGATGQRRWAWWLLALVGTLVAVASKETGFVLPGLLVLVDWMDAAGREPLAARLRRNAPLLLSIVLVWALWLAWWIIRTSGGVPTMTPGFQGLGPLGRAVAMLSVAPQYVRLFLFPLHLSADYSPNFLTAVASLSAATVMGVLALVATAALIALARVRWPVVSFGLAWCVISLVVVCNVVVPTEVLLAERTLYLASVGIVLAAGAIAAQWRPRYPRVTLFTVGAVGALGALRSMTRATVWRSNDDLFPAIVRDAPGSYRGEWIAGMLAYQDGRRAEAMGHLEQAVAIDSTDVGLLSDLADRLEQDSSWSRAGARLDRAFRLKPAALLYAARAIDDYVRGDDLARAEALATVAWPRDSAYIPLRIARSDLAEAAGDAALAATLRLSVARQTSAWQYWIMTAEAAERAGRCDVLDEALARVRNVIPAQVRAAPFAARRRTMRCRP